MRLFLIYIFTCFAVLSANGQAIRYEKLPKAKIADAAQVISEYKLSEEQREIVHQVVKAINTDTSYVISHSTESGWPYPLSNFDYRIAHPDEIKALEVRLVADLGGVYLLMAPEKENQGSVFPIEEDIFLCFSKKGVAVSGTGAQPMEYLKLARARISDAGELISTPGLSGEVLDLVKTEAIKINLDTSYVVSHSTESGWPNPLSDFEYRIEHPDEIKALTVRILADLEYGYLLMVPIAENQRSAFPLTEDIFIVVTKKGVEPE